MTYGIWQEYYQRNYMFSDDQSALGVIGTTSNGVMYLSMPFLFAALSRRWAHRRRITALCGAVVAGVGFFLSSFSTAAWQLVITQGILVAFGCVMMFSPTTLILSEYFSTNNRALALGIVLSSKNITGSICPFIMQALLERYGFRNTLRLWMALTTGLGLLALALMPMDRPGAESAIRRPRRILWTFLRYRKIYIYSIAIMLQSSGYGISQTYLNSYAQSVARVSSTNSTLLLVLFNVPGIVSCSLFGLLCDNKRNPLSANVTTTISSLPAALAAFLLWGLAAPSPSGMPPLILFSLIYGFFASAYSATWGGVIKEMEEDAAAKNEAIDVGIVYGLLNGARGIGYVGGGLAGVRLLKAGEHVSLGKYGYSTQYGPLILFTGLSTLAGGWSVVFQPQYRRLSLVTKRYFKLRSAETLLSRLWRRIGL